MTIHSNTFVSSVPFYLFPEYTRGKELLSLSHRDVRILEGRRFCLYQFHPSFLRPNFLDSDRIALVPQSTQVRDFICQLDGDSTYFVFRKIRRG